MTDIAFIHRQSRAAMLRRSEADAAREHIETCSDLPEIVTEWWGELDSDVLHAHEVDMIRVAIAVKPPDIAHYARRYRRRVFLDSAECETLVEDMAAGAKTWPR